ncbi:MAG: hypothetical protein V4671_29380 [Armatimonadota bacterium]
MKKHIYIAGGIYTLICGLGLALGATLCLALWANPGAGSQNALQFIGPPFLFASCIALLPGLIGGIGLLYFRPWARVVLLLPSLLLVFLVPIGTAIGAYGLWVILQGEVRALLSGAGQDAADVPSPSPPPRAVGLFSPLLSLLIAMACVAAGFFLVIKIGFLIHGDPLPEPFESSVLTGAATMVVVTGFAATVVRIIHAVGTAVSRARIRREADGSALAYREARRLRVAELAADPDPKRARYAPLVEQGESWPEQNIAYYEDPESVITCVHLQPVERAMRRAGIDLRRFQEGDVRAKCGIRYSALERDFEIGLPVRYAEFFEAERWERDHPRAYLICDEHKSVIHVLHPEESGGQALPQFPVSATS